MDDSVVQEAIASPGTSLTLPEALQEPTQAKSVLFQVLYCIANMVVGAAQITLESLLLQLQIGTIVSGNTTGIFAVLITLGAIVCLIMNPLGGKISDRTSWRLGRRRPWLMIGGVITVVSLLLLAFARSIPVVALWWLLLAVGISFVQMSLTAVIPDQVPIRQRATVAGLGAGIGLMVGGLYGQILVAQMFKTVPSAYISLAVSCFIMIGLFLLVMPDKQLPREYVQPFRAREIIAMYWLSPKKYPDFGLIWLARCLIFLGYTTTVNFMFYYLTQAVHYSQRFPGQTPAQGVQQFFAVMVVSIVVASLVGGMLSDRMQRRRLFVSLAGVMMMIGMLLYAFFPVWTMVLVATAFTGVGMGLFLSVDLALASQVLPAAEERGKDISIINTAIFISLILSPIIAGIILNTLQSFPVLFVLMAICALLSAVLITRVRSVR